MGEHGLVSFAERTVEYDSTPEDGKQRSRYLC